MSPRKHPSPTPLAAKERLSQVVEELEDRASDSRAEYVPIYDVLLPLAKELESVLSSAPPGAADVSDSGGAERLAVSGVRTLLGSLDALAVLRRPNIAYVRKEAASALIRAEDFEEKRLSSDWVPELIQEEAGVYDDVGSALQAANKAAIACAHYAQALDEVVDAAHQSAQAVIPSLDEMEEAKAQLLSQVHTLEDPEGEREANHGEMGALLDDAILRNTLCVAAGQDALAGIAKAMQELIEQAASQQAQLATLGRERAVLEHARASLDRVHAKADTLAHDALLEAKVDLSVLDLQAQAANLLSEGREASLAALGDLVEATSLATAEDELNLSLDRMALLQATYHRTALSVFATKARMAMRRQDVEAATAQKQRANAAQDFPLVAKSSQQISELETELDSEAETCKTQETALAEIAEEWGEIYNLVSTLPLPHLVPQALTALQSTWQAGIDHLQDIERAALAPI